ncbi:hypothetical protein NQ318_010407 [Aromia moschata]|uniref:THAP-type domain-containing protein n=1 Tax=Aromia moschata TaxID=1265417 RepID=A0AAV8Y5M7_9CUCU|nr:hypothetical protein NQ318_010407 [Aromia moschata]
MNHYCCVPRCSSWIKRDPQLTFQILPEQGRHQERIDRRKAWILKLRIEKPVNKFMKVCSFHFAEEDYFYRFKDSKKRKILKNLQYLQIHEVMNSLHSDHVHRLIHTLKLQCRLNIPYV